MTLADLVAAVMLLSLVIYVLFGGADFGGGVWDLLASGPRAALQRRVIEAAIAPIWEANHVWLILVIVLLFSAFPVAYAAASTALHIPLAALLLGIVARGSAFVFRHYSRPSDRVQRRWGRVFAVASVVTPVFLGVTLGAISAGRLRVRDGVPTSGFVAPWLGGFQLAVGLFTLALCAFLAAVYLIDETDDRALQDDFRRRALASGVAVAALALACGVAAPGSARPLFGSWWSWPLQLVTGAAAVGAFVSLLARRRRAARAFAVAQVALIVLGWGAAQHPYLIVPDVTIDGAAAPRRTLELLLATLAAGAALLLPSLALMLRVFKRRATDD
jgi:cytochrome d ubiquinol oxidase subunit II